MAGPAARRLLRRALFGGIAAALGAAMPSFGAATQPIAAERWREHARIGVTTPLHECTAEHGCSPAPDGFPALYVQVVSDRALVLGLAAPPPRLQSTEVVRIHSMEGDSSQLPVERTGRSRTVVGFDRHGDALVEHRVHLLLKEPLAKNRRYRLDLAGDPPVSTGFIHAGGAVTPAIQLNQVGYPPVGRKRAYVGDWLGTAGPMPVDGSRFEIVDAESDEVALAGLLESVTTHDPWSGNAVYRADFGALQRPGRYFVRIPGIGRSPEFGIGDTVYAAVYRRVFRLFYHARNSTPVSAPWSDPGRERAGGVPAHLNALIHPAVGASPLGRGEKPYAYRAVGRGWFDAGDYGQYVVNAAPVWHAFGMGVDLVPGAFAGDDLGLPESGNGVPDVIDELSWGMDWLLGMQDPEDGGVYSRVAPERWDESLPGQVDQPRFLFEKTTHATVSFAAAAAIHARLLAPWYPDRSDRALAAARAAWDFVTRMPQWPPEGQRYRNPPGVHAGEYADTSATDNRLWAAAELFRATRDPRFLDACLAILADFTPDPTAGVTFRQQGLAAYWALHRALAEGGEEMTPLDDAAYRRLDAELRRVLVSAADWHLRKSEEHPFGAPMHQHRPYTGWGSFAHSSRAVLPLLQAWRISGDSRYRDAAASMTDPQLGANPQSISYITGTGWRSPAYPLSKLDQYKAAPGTVAGIPVNGPHFHLPALWPSTRAVNEAYLPMENAAGQNAYPALRRFVDARPLPPMSEPTVAEIAVTAVAFGLLSDASRLGQRSP